MSTIRGYTQIKENSINGANLIKKTGIFSETNDYSELERVLWEGYIYQVKIGQSVTGTTINDFTASPDLDTVNWEIVIDVTTIIDITHADLLILQNTSSLIAGQSYRITDHVTKYNQPVTDIVKTGNIEPLIVTALTNNVIDKLARSEQFTQDIIYYDINNIICSDGTTERKGKIYYREDTVRQLKVEGEDWRNIKNRRWAVDAVEWVGGTMYTARNVIKDANGNIYKCTKNTNGTITPSSDGANWVLWLDLSLTNFWSFTNNKSAFNVGNINTTNLIINNTIDGTDFQDFYMFAIYDELDNSSGEIDGTGAGLIGAGYENIEIDGFSDNQYTYYDSVSLHNSVFMLFPDGGYYDTVCYGNKFGLNFTNNTLLMSLFNGNTIGNGCSYNTINCDFHNNTIGNGCSYNTINCDFHNNTIGKDFRSNTIDEHFYNNTIDEHFYNNTISRYFRGSSIGGSFNNNIIGRHFSDVVTDYDFKYNTIGKMFYSNIIGNNFQKNYIKDYIRSTDFTSATHVYESYDCELFTKSNGSYVLTFLDGTNTIQYKNITD